jgi:hypothetical protein
MYNDTIPTTRDAYFLAVLPLNYSIAGEKSTKVRIQIPSHLQSARLLGSLTLEDSRQALTSSVQELNFKIK